MRVLVPDSRWVIIPLLRCYWDGRHIAPPFLHSFLWVSIERFHSRAIENSIDTPRGVTTAFFLRVLALHLSSPTIVAPLCWVLPFSGILSLGFEPMISRARRRQAMYRCRQCENEDTCPRQTNVGFEDRRWVIITPFIILLRWPPDILISILLWWWHSSRNSFFFLH